MAEQLKKSICLFNSDGTYKLEIVETLLMQMNKKHGFNFAIEKCNFRLQQIADICETTIPQLQMDYAIFVVHANESRLSINEDNAGIGYARVYRALLQATKNRVLIVIGGDDNYKDNDEEQRVVISRWARRKVASQFDEEYLDGRKSFIFSWDKQHREIHEEALLHYFDPSKDGQKFENKPKPKREHPEITSPAANDFQEKTAGKGDRNNRRVNVVQDRSDRKQDKQKRELRGDQEQPNYGALIGDYPAGAILLQTRLRYGEISYEKKHIVKREGKWKPSERQASELMNRFKSTNDITVRFVSQGNGGIQYSAFPTPRLRHCFTYCCGRYYSGEDE